MPEVREYFTRYHGKVKPHRVKPHTRRNGPFTVAIASNQEPPTLGTRNPRAKLTAHEQDLLLRELGTSMATAAMIPEFDPSTIYIVDATTESPADIAHTLSHETLHGVLGAMGERVASHRLDRDTMLGIDRMGFGRLHSLPGLRETRRPTCRGGECGE